MLQRIDLVLRPALGEAVAEDAAVVRHVAVEIGGALPQADRGEVLRLQRRALPLVLGVIGDAVQSDLAVRPRLHAGPLDALRQILRFAKRPDVDHTGRTSGAAAVDADHDIIVRHPLLRVDHLPALILVGRTGRHVGADFAHPLPLLAVKIVEVQPLAVGP
jgi:hypothetical protein